MGSVAAAAAVVAFLLPEWRRRPRLKIEFERDRFDNRASNYVLVWVRVANTGSVPINRLDLFPVMPGEVLIDPQVSLSLDPGDWHEESVRVAKPSRVEVTDAGPVFKVSLGMLGRAASHDWLAWHPASRGPHPKKLR